MSKTNTESQIEQKLSGIVDCNRLIDLWSLSTIAEVARYPEGYVASSDWASSVVLSKEGTELYELAGFPKASVTEADAKMAMFGRFYYHDLLIDVEKSNLEKIIPLLDVEIAQSKLRLPFRFGRALYDRFNELFPAGEINTLPHNEVSRLLDGTPQGVFQVGRFLTGPLGIISSTQQRRLPPTSLPGVLWHSRRQGEAVSHYVAFEPPLIGVVEAYATIGDLARKIGRASAWHLPLSRRIQQAEGSRYKDISLNIADCILEKERSRLVEHAIKSRHGKQLRAVLGSPPRKASLSQGSAEEIAGRLTPEQQLQLLMTLQDAELAELIDDCCAKKMIEIPSYEIRRAKQRTASLDTVRATSSDFTELSSLGVRYVSENSTVLLIALISEAYRSNEAIEELSWKLRAYGATNYLQALSDFVRSESPTLAVRKLILSSKPTTASVVNSLNISSTFTTDDEIEKQILWKCGYSPTEYSPILSRIQEQLNAFNQTILSLGDELDERGRAAIRSAGVNLFVYLEDVLEVILAYNTWLLSSDHFASTKLTYLYSDALKAVGDVLVPRVSDTSSEEIAISWDLAGRNTLGPILRLLNELCAWIEELPDSDRSKYTRPKSDWPLGAQQGPRRFAFAHTQLWADCGHNELQRFARGFREIVRILQRADVAGIRNGLDHKRSAAEFPSTDRMFKFINQTQEAMSRIEVGRFYPKEYFLQSRGKDRYEQSWYELRDYRGTRLELRSPSHLYGIGWPSVLGFDAPVLVAPNLLPAPNAELCFRIGHESIFTKYWSGYPKTRDIKIPPNSGDLVDIPPQETQAASQQPVE